MQKLLRSLLIVSILIGCTNAKDPLEEILQTGSSDFNSVLTNPSHEIQIIYGEIVDDSIIHHTYSVNKQKFFYPASTVKMPVAFAALKKAEELNMSFEDPILIDSTGIYPRNVHYDSIANDSIRLRSLVQEIFTISGNTAYNILYGWLGKDYINELYSNHGLQTRIVHQLSESAFSFNPQSNVYQRMSRVLSKDKTIEQEESAQFYSLNVDIQDEVKGIGYTDSLGTLVNAPFDFSKKNFVPIEELLTILEMAIRPDLIGENNPFNFSTKTSDFIRESMELLPKDMPHPYDTLPDNYVKFLIVGNDRNGSIPTNIKILNKVGWAYGYLLDVAYIEDSENDISFFLAAVIHVNKNQIYNDGIYEYEEVGLPFLDELGELVYAHEKNK